MENINLRGRVEIMEDILAFFKNKGISIQISLDIDKQPTVHAFKDNGKHERLYRAEDETLMGALDKMKEGLFPAKPLNKRDRVAIIDNIGRTMTEGMIVNINDFREPCHKYAVEVDGYTDDLLFFGERQLIKLHD